MKSTVPLFVAGSLLLTVTSALLAQGPLTPPGPPAPTMKTLDQIEPRRPISSLPITISERGSYVVTADPKFSAATGHAITIAASDVSIDLNGFTLSSTAEVTGDAIRIDGSLQNIEVKNGAIVGTTTVTVSGSPPNQAWATVPGGFAYGINCPSSPEAKNCQFSHLRISGARVGGLDAGIAASIEHVTVMQNGGFGMDAAEATVTSSSAYLNNGNGIGGFASAISNCSAHQNQGIGLAGLSVANCAATFNGGNGIQTASGTVANCRASSNQGNGIVATSGSVMNSVANNNGNNGIAAGNGVVAFSRAAGNNLNANGSQDISADGSARTGNNPGP